MKAAFNSFEKYSCRLFKKKKTSPHVKYQIFSVAYPPKCIMRFTRRKVSNITEEGFETEVLWITPGRLLHMCGEERER